MEEQQYFQANQALWNAKTAVHATSDFYDNEAFLKGKSSLKPSELEALGDVSGKSLLHLQCHFGQDSLSWARMGAKVTAIDLSDASIALARQMAEQLALDVRFINCNVYDSSEHLHDEQFDIVFTSYGTICWLPDLEKWAATISRHLKPGGTFCIVEFHPAYNMYDWPADHIAFPYFGGKGPYEEEVEGSYSDNAGKEPGAKSQVKGKEYFWMHSLHETAMPLLKQGLQWTDFTEYPYSYYKAFPGLVDIGGGRYQWEGHEGMVPMMFRMVFQKPGSI